jgi:large subunit ribosomal protein L7/L12
MAFDKDAFLKQIEEMTVLELADLVKALEDKFGVSAAAPVAMAAAPTASFPFMRTFAICKNPLYNI